MLQTGKMDQKKEKEGNSEELAEKFVPKLSEEEELFNEESEKPTVAVENQNTEVPDSESEESDFAPLNEAEAEASETLDETMVAKASEKERKDYQKLGKKYQELHERYLRLQAELENFKRRSKTEMQAMLRYAQQPLALSFMTGLDNLERAMQHAYETIDNQEEDSFLKGIEMVHNQFLEALSKNQITRIEAKGELFDPSKHEAMGMIETDEVEPNHIIAVFQAGYMLHDRVIRPAMVQVAKKPE